MRALLYWSNLRYTGKKDISPDFCNQVLNRIFILLYQSQAVMKQFTQMYTPYRCCQKILIGSWISLPERQFRHFGIIVRNVLLLFLFFFISVTVFSQTTDDIDPMPIKLKGQVLNLEDESPVPNANIPDTGNSPKP